MAADGAKALVLAEALRPRVLLLNAELPSLDGVSLLRELDAVWNAEVTIMLSTSGARSVLNAAQAAGVDHFFTLPVAPEIVLARSCGEKTAVEQRRSVESDAAKMLGELGFLQNRKGYPYIREALLHAMTKELYPAVARRFETSAACVERSIRHAVEELWSHSDAEELHRIFGAAVDPKRGKPTNSAFLAALSERLALEAEKRGG